MQRMTDNAAIPYGAMLAAAFWMVGSAAAAAPPQTRIDEIAAMLDAEPIGLGPTCADRAAWDALGRRDDFRAIVAAAEKLLTQPLPEQSEELFLDFSRTGNRRPWERVAFSRRGRIKTLVLAECVENKGRFVPAIRDLVAALCDEPTWVYPAHDRSLGNFRRERIDIDLGSAYVAGELSLAYYLLGDKLGEDTRTLIQTTVAARILDPFTDMVRGKRDSNWWLKGENNWNSVCLAGVTEAALSLVRERERRAFFIAAAEQSSKHYLSGFTADGYCSEGLAYWNYGFTHYAQLAIVIERATHGRVDLMAADGARKPAGFGARSEIIGGVYPTFADCPMNTRPSAILVDYIERRRSAESRTPRASTTKGRGLAQTVAFTFGASGSRSGAEQGVVEEHLRTWFDEAGVLICRPAPGTPERLGVALKGGHNAEHHNHNDVGSFIVVVNDRPVLVDPGTEVYTARTFSSRRYESKVLNSFGHPVPVVAGKLQRTGARACGRVLEREFTDARDSLTLDISAAYDVASLQRLERKFVYERGSAECLRVIDTVEFSEPERFELALVTFGKWSQVSTNVLRVDDEGRAVDVEILTGGVEFAVNAEEIDEDVRIGKKPTRIAITLTQTVRAADVTMRISPVQGN